MGVEGINHEEKPTDKGFGKNVEDFLNHIRTRLGDVVYNFFGSSANFYNFLGKIEQGDPFIDNSDNHFLTYTYRKNGKYGFVVPEKKENGKIELVKKDAIYDRIYSKGGYFIVEKNEEKKCKKGLCNRWGMEIIESKYDKIYYEGGYFIVEENGKKGLFNCGGKNLLELKYDEIKVIDNIIFLKDGDSRLMMNKKSKKLIRPEPRYTEILQDRWLKLWRYHVVIIKSENGKIGLLSTKNGQIKVEPSYDKYRIDFLRNRIIFENTSTGESNYYKEESEDMG